MKRLDDIGKNAMNLRLREYHGESLLEVSMQLPTTSFINESEAVGRQYEKELIVWFLLNNSPWSYNGLCVLPIVGIGGLGKTTLAQLVCNDERIKKHFDLRIWIFVSESFDVTRVTKAIMESITLEPCELKELDALQKALVKILEGKRYLLVLDDVWDESNYVQHWSSLRLPLSRGADGSGIIVTTRSAIVASNMGTVLPFLLGPMPEVDSLLLLNQKAFANVSPDANQNLVKISRQIVHKCHGLPLAAKTLGSLLNSRVDENAWNMVLKSDTWSLHSMEDGNTILPALKLSYQHLPSHLKRCFAYCSLFPKHYIFNRDRLCQLWMAEGFIEPEENKPMEYTAQSYFDGLLKRSFLQYTYSYQHQRFIYTMHDLIHDLAQSISGDAYVREQNAKLDNLSRKTRHLSICDKLEQRMFKASLNSRKLRTFLLLHERAEWFEQVPVSEMFDKLKCLRVLDFSRRFQIKKLPSSIGGMIHLRYLDLSYTSLRSLPTSICNLYNLQTLILCCTGLNHLPKSIGNLVNLQHFDCRTQLKRLPKSIGNLVNLLYLDLSSNQLKSLPDCIGNMISLRYLNLSGTRLSKLPASICNLCDLRTLILKSCSVLELPNQTKDLVNLQYLNVDSCTCLVSMPPGIGRLTSLKMLPVFIVGKDVECGVGQLSVMNNLQGKLQILNLENAVNLEESNLKNKQYLSELCLKWSYNHNSLQDGEAAKHLLGSLQPHTNLNMLQIENYGGTEFHSWVGDPSFAYLTSVRLHYCTECKILPSLGQLPLLQYLDIKELNGVKCIGQEFYGQGSVKGFPSLKKLSVYMSNLEEWSGIEENEFPKLLEISIRLSMKLKKLPYLPPCVTNMKLFSCEELSSLPMLPNLQKLEISFFKGVILHSLPQLISMKSLTISIPDYLDSLPKELLQPLSALKTLKLEHCDELCARSEWEGLQYLQSLEYLEIERFRYTTHLPERGWPTTIRCLRLDDGTMLQALPKELKNLTSLLRLEISDCPQLMFLPEEGLPTMLKELSINKCPLLAKRCRKDKGEEWYKIAHIPHIRID